MNPFKRALALESIEERSLPSVTFISFNAGFGGVDHLADRGGSDIPSYAHIRPSDFSQFQGRGFGAQPVFVRVVFGFDAGAFASASNWYGSGQDSLLGDIPTTTSGSTTQDSGDSHSDGAAKTSSTQVHAATTVRIRTDVTQSDISKTDAVSLAVNSQAQVRIREVQTSARVEEQVQAVQAQIVAVAPSQLISARMSYPVLDGPGVDATQAPAGSTGAVPSESVEPPTLPPPADQTDQGPVTDVQPANATLPSLLPYAGAIPFDLTLVGTATTNFLNRVSDLTPAWPSAMTQFEDYLWTATAVLLGAGAVRATVNQRNQKNKQSPTAFDSTLAEWEEKNAGRVG